MRQETLRDKAKLNEKRGREKMRDSLNKIKVNLEVLESNEGIEKKRPDIEDEAAKTTPFQIFY
jgi:hypothetical protein